MFCFIFFVLCPHSHPLPRFCLFALVSELGYLSCSPCWPGAGCPLASVCHCHHTGLACSQGWFMLQCVLVALYSVDDWSIICYVGRAFDYSFVYRGHLTVAPFWPLWTVMLLWVFVCHVVWAYVFSSLRLKTELLELFSWLSFFQNCIFNTPHNGLYVNPSIAVSTCPSLWLLLSLKVWSSILSQLAGFCAWN